MSEWSHMDFKTQQSFNKLSVYGNIASSSTIKNIQIMNGQDQLPHWGQASENWVISSGNGLSPAWCEAITWTNVESLPNGLLAVHLKL